MKFKIRCTKLSNQFFFLSNMSRWRFWCRKEYNREWLKIIGKLDKIEKKTLDDFAAILNKYSQSQSKIRLPDLFSLTSKEKIWHLAKKALSQKDYLLFRNIFKIFDFKYRKIWRIIKLDKKLAEFSLRNNLKKYQNQIKNSVRDISILYNKKFPSQKLFNIYLIILPKTVKGRGGKYGRSSVVLEGSVTSFKEKRMIEIMIHEIIHSYFESPYFYSLVVSFIKKKELLNLFQKSKILKQTGSVYFVIKEIIAGSLIPKGYLSKKYFDYTNNISPINLKKSKKYYQLLDFAVQPLYPTIKEYLQRKKPIDKEFLKKIIEVWSEFERK